LKITDYFIKHPVSGIVLNALFILLGLLSFQNLPVREYPEVDMPVVTVVTNYPSASAELVETSVTNILEDALAGVEGLESLRSSSKSGSSSIDMNFRTGYPMSQALIAVRDAVALVAPSLPKQAFDPVVQKASQSEGLPFIALSLESSVMDFAQVTHYCHLNLKNALRSLKGVASVQIWGQPYCYTLTLDPQKLFEFGISVEEIYHALEKANLSLPAGKFRNELPVTLKSDLESVEDYEQLLVKTIHSQGHSQPVYLGMLAKVELKTSDKDFRIRVNGRPGLCLALERASDANPLEVSNLVREEVQALSKSLPAGLSLELFMDQADFIRASLKNIESALLEAAVLVLIVVFLFLKNWRASLIPLMTIPVSLLGAFLFLKFFGFSLNIMTLLAMVLAIGLVVDDAIVVLENISRYMEEGFSPMEAALKGSKEMGFAIVAMTLTLASVYMPIAFVQGVVGDLFIEFAIALAGSVLISGMVALTLSPLMCARILKASPKTYENTHEQAAGPDLLQRLESAYALFLRKSLKHPGWILLLSSLSLAVSVLMVYKLPSELAPKEDRGLIGAFIPSLPGKSLGELEGKVIEAEKILKAQSEIKGMISFMGYWGGSVVTPLKPKLERSRTASQIVTALMPQTLKMPSVDVWPWSVDSGLPGVNHQNANELVVAVCSIESYKELFARMQALRQKLEESALFESVRHDLRLDSMGYCLDLEPSVLAKLGISPYQVARTVEVFFSGDQSLQFQKDGMLYPIRLQTQKAPWSLEEIYIAKSSGENISLGSLAKMSLTAQPKNLDHYNQMRSAVLRLEVLDTEDPAHAKEVVDSLLKKDLPASYRFIWMGSAKEQEKSFQTMALLFVLALVFIYSILAVQFENFKDPLIVMATVPLGAVGALALVGALGQSMNIYTQIGLITLVGLITKHGILIVEFANQKMEQGHGAFEAAYQAACLRLRPILMTSAAMIVGSLPLLFSKDAGSEARQVLGAVLVGGLSLGTLFTLFAIPVFYHFMKKHLGKAS
jgi:multidrug efflux pump